MKNSLLLLLNLFIIFNLGMANEANAQEDHRECGSSSHYTEMMNDATFSANRVLIEQQTQLAISQPGKHIRSIKTIPVVVHVIYNTASQNISDAQVNSQIAVLNADFRKLNADFANAPAAFASLGADCELQFVLAQRDPSGNATNGITRTYSTNTSWSVNDQMKFSANGGADAWPAASYLNIWVCKMSGSILGYAQFPGGNAATDGVVIATKAFGTIPGSGLSPVYNKGRTATHEIGHWLNLFHIWGDDGTSCSGTDLVNDTPNQGGANYGCPTFPHLSCPGDANGDMFMNYMDYSNDACMNMFTMGQKDRVDALFIPGGARYSLLNSLGAFPPAPPVCDVPSNLSLTNILETEATLNWIASAGALGYNIEYKQTNETSWTLINVSTNTFQLTGLLSNTIYECRIATVCNSGVSAASNIVNFSTLAPPPPPPVCTNNYEPNNLPADATPVIFSQAMNSQIATSGDVDYYRFMTTSDEPKFKIDLTNLPDDYDLKLYTSRGRLLASSSNGSLTSESITYNVSSSAAMYLIAVSGYNGAMSANACYELFVQKSANILRSEESANEVSKPEIITYPNPVQHELNATLYLADQQDVHFKIYNGMGQVVVNQHMSGVQGHNSFALNTEGLANGFYLLELNTEAETKLQKFIISH